MKVEGNNHGSFSRFFGAYRKNSKNNKNFAKLRSKMTTVSRFPPQNDAGLRALKVTVSQIKLWV